MGCGSGKSIAGGPMGPRFEWQGYFVREDPRVLPSSTKSESCRSVWHKRYHINYFASRR